MKTTKTLVIYAHPDTGGHCSIIKEEVKKALERFKIDYELIDLYKIGYDPILHEKEHYTRGKRDVSVQNQKFQEKIRESDELIFIYPIWWNSMPAILKGFFDRVFTARFAFIYKNPWYSPIPVPIGLLKGKNAIVFITSGATNLLSMIFQGFRAQKIMKNDILRFCGIKSKVYQLGNANDLTEKNIKRIKKTVERAISSHYR